MSQPTGPLIRHGRDKVALNILIEYNSRRVAVSCYMKQRPELSETRCGSVVEGKWEEVGNVLTKEKSTYLFQNIHSYIFLCIFYIHSYRLSWAWTVRFIKPDTIWLVEGWTHGTGQVQASSETWHNLIPVFWLMSSSSSAATVHSSWRSHPDVYYINKRFLKRVLGSREVLEIVHCWSEVP